MEIRTFFELVNKSRVTKECVKKASVERGSQRGSLSLNRGKSFTPRGPPFMRGGFVPQRTQGQNSFRRPNNNNNNASGRRFGKQPLNEQACTRCGNYHPGVHVRLLGALHSFIEFEKASELELKIVTLGYDLKVYNATHEAMVTRLGCPQVSFRVKQRDFVHNLVCLPMVGLDLILGLDWLSKNHVLLDYSAKLVYFISEDTEGPIVVNNYYLNSMIVNCSGAKCQGILLLTAGVSSDDQNLEQIPVVCEFPEVFPDDTEEFPPH
ncbi:uncharacterized protein LOC130982193 [Arachis stenosperma]|uniref:uncharacterized protein LOC130982193 n=1 Tax=Arachis stenosperma TaxID=217475 RepID=UPI0025ABB7EF|nr:uncharacterized protein LOC130982193 [Arachis stenosperma]